MPDSILSKQRRSFRMSRVVPHARLTSARMSLRSASLGCSLRLRSSVSNFNPVYDSEKGDVIRCQKVRNMIGVDEIC